MVDQKRIRQLDLNLLKVFKSLYEEQNMTHAANALHITPSAVSHAITRLRDVLDDPLFRRANNKMVPTAACQRMAPLIIDNLSRLQQILQHWGEFNPATSQHHVRIGMHDALEPALLPKLNKVLARQAPSVSFASIKIDRTNLHRELSTGHIDIALDVAIPIKPTLFSRKLWSSDFCVLLRHGHPLVGKLSKKNYLQASHISVSNRPTGMTIEDTFFQTQGLTRHSTIRCQNYFAATEIVKTSDQLLTVARTMSEQFIDDNIVVEPIPFNISDFGTYLYWHENTDQDSAASWLREIIFNNVKIS